MAQIAPVWLNKQATLEKVQRTILQAAAEEAELVVFGEGVVPGYPFWLALTDGAVVIIAAHEFRFERRIL